MRISFDKEGKFNIGDIEEFYLDFFSAALYLKHYAIINKLFGLPQLYQKNPQKKTNVFFFYFRIFRSSIEIRYLIQNFNTFKKKAKRISTYLHISNTDGSDLCKLTFCLQWPFGSISLLCWYIKFNVYVTQLVFHPGCPSL
jgi:hypothetical protein